MNKDIGKVDSDGSAFRHRGLETVVDTTRQAEFDMKMFGIDGETQDYFARQVKEIPRSVRDRGIGDLGIREICGWDVMFTISDGGDRWVVTIAGVDRPGEMETHLNMLWRGVLELLPAPFRILLAGRRRK